MYEERPLLLSTSETQGQAVSEICAHNATSSTAKSYIRVIQQAPTKLDARPFNYKAGRQTDMARAREMKPCWTAKRRSGLTRSQTEITTSTVMRLKAIL